MSTSSRSAAIVPCATRFDISLQTPSAKSVFSSKRYSRSRKFLLPSARDNPLWNTHRRKGLLGRIYPRSRELDDFDQVRMRDFASTRTSLSQSWPINLSHGEPVFNLHASLARKNDRGDRIRAFSSSLAMIRRKTRHNLPQLSSLGLSMRAQIQPPLFGRRPLPTFTRFFGSIYFMQNRRFCRSLKCERAVGRCCESCSCKYS